eukprot:TRINITY_DN1022_c1_g2_i2.p1 TRINITY_DN1022_c1_g2~~TRINITY_DN1022_c1_g2_i2.p1  ORF type:complete len:221 (-),score=0.76 TRINITY_DN1022_c1_g2_i2:269-931(-)
MDGWVFAENFAPVPPIHSPRPGHSHQFPLGTFAQVVRLPPQPAPPRRPQPTAKQEGAEDKEGTNEDQNNGDDTSKLTVIVPRQAYAPGIRPLVATPTGPMPGLMSPRGMPHCTYFPSPFISPYRYVVTHKESPDNNHLSSTFPLLFCIHTQMPCLTNTLMNPQCMMTFSTFVNMLVAFTTEARSVMARHASTTTMTLCPTRAVSVPLTVTWATTSDADVR